MSLGESKLHYPLGERSAHDKAYLHQALLSFLPLSPSCISIALSMVKCIMGDVTVVYRIPVAGQWHL